MDFSPTLFPGPSRPAQPSPPSPSFPSPARPTASELPRGPACAPAHRATPSPSRAAHRAAAQRARTHRASPSIPPCARASGPAVPAQLPARKQPSRVASPRASPAALGPVASSCASAAAAQAPRLAAQAARSYVRCAHAAARPRVRSQRTLFFFPKTVLRIPLAHDASKTALLAHLVQFSRPRRFSSPRSRPPPRRHSYVSPGVSPSMPCARCAVSLATAPRCGRRRARRRGELALPSSLPFLPCTVPSSELRSVGEKLPSLFSPTFFPVAAVPASLAPSRRGLVVARSPLPSLAASRPCARLFPCRRESQHAASRCPGVQTPRALALLLRAAAST
jgi:hypothetical protein